MDVKIKGNESDSFVPKLRKESQFKRQCAQLIATAAFGMMVLSVGTLITAPTILVGAMYNTTEDDVGTLTSAEDNLYSPDSPFNSSFSDNTPWSWSNGTDLENEYTVTPHTLKQVTDDGKNTNEYVETNDLKLTKYQAAWLGSIVLVVQPVGSIVSGFIQGYMGRRNGMMATTVVQFIGWISIYFSFNLASLFSATVLMGLSIGFMEAPGLSFLGEVIEPKYRGCFANIAMNMWLFGVLFLYLLGAVLDWRYVCLTTAAVPVINFLMLSLIPESPTFLLLRGRERQAEAALRWLRGWTDHDKIRDEYEALIESLNIPQRHNGTYLSPTAQHGKDLPRKAGKGQLSMLCERRVRFPLLLIALLFITQHSVSLQGIKPFLIKILETLKIKIPPYWILVGSGILQLVGVFICATAIRYIGKRTMIIISGTSSTIICLLLSLYMYVQPGLPIIAVILFSINYLANGLGIMSLPWCLVAEVFPTECRGSAAGIAAASSYIFGFLVTITYKPLESVVSLSGCLLIYAAVGVVGTTVAYYKLPETEGKSLEEIQQLFTSPDHNHQSKPPKGHSY